MEGMQTIDDNEIQEKVESLAGKGARVIDCEKSSSFQTEEVLLINGFPVPLQGEEGKRIKTALITGQVPPCELLNEILLRAGILKNPVELETTLNVKSTTKTTELVTLRDKDGVLVDERMKEIEEDNEFNSSSTEVWKKEDKKDEHNLLGLGKQIERITFPSTSTSSSSSSKRNGGLFTSTNAGGASSSSASSSYRNTPTPTHSHASARSGSSSDYGGSSTNRFSGAQSSSKSSSPQPLPFVFNTSTNSSPLYHNNNNNNNNIFSSSSPEAPSSSSRSPSMSSYSAYSPRFSVSRNLPSIIVHSEPQPEPDNSNHSIVAINHNNKPSSSSSSSNKISNNYNYNASSSSSSYKTHKINKINSLYNNGNNESTIETPSRPHSRSRTPSSLPLLSIHSTPNSSPKPSSNPSSVNNSPKTYKKLNESQKIQELRSTNVDSPTQFFTPTLASLHLELDGIPIRVSYETFV